ncbi:MmgE/PrpD family protein [Rhizobium lusitanum]|uniref:MmgE/PrpD family protein n=1 Tax=Rhizobium lusitanum TaxID=293958 RepID=UPI0015741FC7|nr:MmgE/PrpD family protein [Rhizobium lusitanum]NTJ11513.1 MmgE/PrpD family protein [Rhizobium lusitanum]
MRPITQEIAAYAVNSKWEALPQAIRNEAGRAFLNWFGCSIGGSGEELVDKAIAAVGAAAKEPNASIIGRRARTDMANAAFLNCLSSSALAYDDTHLATVTHPTGPVAAALFAVAETTSLSGSELLHALVLGIELQCRMSNVILLPPAKENLSLYMTGVTGPIGVAAAVGRVFGLDERRMRWAIGHAATQAAGFRATHGAMSGLVVPAFATRAGIFAVQLAAAGVECVDNALEAPRGFVDVHSVGACIDYAVDGLGEHFELSAIAYKPYPCGIVVHPVIDVCRQAAAQITDVDGQVEKVELFVPPLTIALANRRHPKDALEAMVSLHHWAAAVFVRRTTGVMELRQATIDDRDMIEFRNLVTAVSDPALDRDQARVAIVLASGRCITSSVEHARGSMCRPLSDNELHEKFITQSEMVFDARKSRRLLDVLRGLEEQADSGAAVSGALH